MVGRNIVASWQGCSAPGTLTVLAVTGATELMITMEPVDVVHGPRPDGAGMLAVVETG
jgi:hypothetical protein